MKTKKISDNNYVNVQGFMRTVLNLKGNELLTYAIIYGFSQDEENGFTGSLSYLSEWLGSTVQTALRTLQKLCDKNLIIKEETTVNNIKYCKYYINFETLKGYCKNYSTIVKNTAEYCKNDNTRCKNVNGGAVKITANNKYNNKDNNKDINKKENSKTKTSTSSKKSKKEKGIDLVISKFEEYDFSDKVKEKLLEFYEDRMDNKDYPASNQLNVMFNELSEVSEQKQLEAISNSIKQGYKGIFINKNNSRKQSYRLDTTDIETVEEHNQKISDIQNKIEQGSSDTFIF